MGVHIFINAIVLVLLRLLCHRIHPCPLCHLVGTLLWSSLLSMCSAADAILTHGTIILWPPFHLNHLNEDSCKSCFFSPLAATIMIDCFVWFIKRYMSVYLAVMVVVPWHASHRNGTIDLIFLQLWERTKSIIFYIFLAIHALGSVRLHRRLDRRMCHGHRSNGQHNLLQRFCIIDIIFVRW